LGYFLGFDGTLLRLPLRGPQVSWRNTLAAGSRVIRKCSASTAVCDYLLAKQWGAFLRPRRPLSSPGANTASLGVKVVSHKGRGGAYSGKQKANRSTQEKVEAEPGQVRLLPASSGGFIMVILTAGVPFSACGRIGTFEQKPKGRRCLSAGWGVVQA